MSAKAIIQKTKVTLLLCALSLTTGALSAYAQDDDLSFPALPGPSTKAADPFFSAGEDQELSLDVGQGAFSKSDQQIEEEARKEAFDAALQGLLPLRPDEIRELLERFDRTQESVALPVYPAPTPEMAVETLSLDPGTKPAVIKVSYGHVTTLNILDSSGQPWPIQDITWAGNFEVIESSGEGAHIVRISPQSEFANGNMSIRLLTLNTPIIMTLATNRETVHYRFDAIIPSLGPLAETPIINRGISTTAGDSTLASVLQGVLPDSAEKMDIAGVDSRTSAYKLKGQTFVRTPLTLLSPGWSSSVTSADGTTVYAINETPVLLLSDGGKMVRARLSEREDLLDER